MKLVESTFVTLDGVISEPQIWAAPYWDEEHDAYANALMADADALLLGRETYEVFAEAWPAREGDLQADMINALPKYVASRTLTEAKWNASIIEGEVAEAVKQIKEQPGRSILKYGTGELDRTLIEHKLIDEFHLWIFPVYAGEGQRIFDGFGTEHLALLDTKVFKSGIVVHTYGPK